MKVGWNELPEGSHRASEEVQRERARKAQKIIKRMGNTVNNRSDHVLVGHMSEVTLHVVTDALISEVPTDSSRLVHL